MPQDEFSKLPVANQVDALIEVEKTLIGHAGWKCDVDTGKCRISWPVAVDGVPIDATLSVNASPLEDFYSFSITLNYPPCVSRLDYVPPSKGHSNPVFDSSQYEPIVYGPHYHSWKDNATLATNKKLPEKLNYAVSVPGSVRNYEDAMFWFCDNVNIVLTTGQLTPLPSKGKLL